MSDRTSIRQLGLRADPRHRTVGEARIIEQLLLHGFAFEVHAGDEVTASRDAALALQHWIELGLAWRAGARGERLFDPAEVMNFMRTSGYAGDDVFWTQRLVATYRRNALMLRGGEPCAVDVPSPATLAPQRFAVKLRRVFDLRSAATGANTQRLFRLPLPLEDDALTDLRITPVADVDRHVDFKIQPGRLDARVVASAERIELGFDATFVSIPAPLRPPARTLLASEIDLYTAPREGLIQVTPRVIALAERLRSTAGDQASCVAAFWNYLIVSMNCGVLHYDDLIGGAATDWAIETQWVDCQLAAALLVSMCRSLRIPARLVSGYLLYSNNASYHYWAEIWMQDSGWRSMDFMASDLSQRGRDPAWQDYLFGNVDYRMKTQCLPRLFNYNPAMPFPDAWHLLSRIAGSATETAFYATDTGALIYSDTVSAQRMADR